MVIVVLIGAVIGFFVWRSRHGAPTTQQGQRAGGAGGPGGFAGMPVSISTAKAQRGNIGVFVNALGLVIPVNTVAVRSRVDGQLEKVLYQEGQLVKQGDKLVELDPRLTRQRFCRRKASWREPGAA